MIDYRYRVWLLKQLAESFVLPAGIVFATLRVLEGLSAHVALSSTTRTTLYTLAIPVYWIGNFHISRWLVKRKAKRLGVNLPPVISGKRIGNVDLLKR